jgi:hypothetical protein
MEKLRGKISDWFKKNPNFDLVELDHVDVKEDPVRPELPVSFRTSYGKKIYGLKDEQGDIVSVICVAHTMEVPSSVAEMDRMSKDAYLQSTHRAGMVGNITVAYTVWAKKKGGGKHIVNELYKKIQRERYMNRLVTLSPLTDMARNFHLKNGAKELRKNETTVNYEYDIELEQWEKLLDRVKARWRKTTWSLK